MKKNIIITLAIVLLAVFVRFVFASWGQFMQEKRQKSQASPTVVLGDVQEANVIRQIEAPGRILSKYRVDVMARIEGYLTKSYFKEGDYVKKGQVLFQIEPQEWLYDVQKARANVQNTKAQLIYADKQLKRGSILVKKDYISKAEYDQMLSNRDALKGQLASFQASLRDAQRNYGYTSVRAPVDGQVGMITVTVGNYVNTSVGALTTVYSNNPIYVTFPIDSKEYLKITETESADAKRKVELIFPTGEKYKYSGVQDFHDNVIDQTTGTITMRATFPNKEGRLINGEYVKVYVYSNKPVNVPVVPQTAVLENPEGKYVYVLKDNNVPEIRFIKTSGQYKNNWIVDSGIKVGDKILVEGLQKVIPDVPVKAVDLTTFKKTKVENVKKKHFHIPNVVAKLKKKFGK